MAYPSEPPETQTFVEPPNNRSAEEAVLGAVLINAEALIEVTEFLAPDDFYIHRNKFVFEAMLKLLEAGTPIDIVTITSQLWNDGLLNEIGGSAYIIGLINATPSSLYAVHYAKLIKEASICRKMLFSAGDIAKLGTVHIEQQSALQFPDKYFYARPYLWHILA